MEKRFRYIILLVVLATSIMFLYPTLKWYFFIDQELKTASTLSRSDLKDFATSKAEADVKALETLLEKDKDSLIPADFDYFVDEIKEKGKKTYTVADLFSAFPGDTKESNIENVKDVAEAHYREEVFKVKDMKKTVIQLGLDIVGGVSVILEPNLEKFKKDFPNSSSDKDLDRALNSSLEVLSGRIDQFGISEPKIRRLEDNKIMVEIPGDNDPERVNSFLRGTGSLKLQIVDDELSAKLQAAYSKGEWKEGDKFELSPNRAIVPYVKSDAYRMDKVIKYIVLKTDEKNTFDGSNIGQAQVSRSKLGAVVVTFSIKSSSIKDFATLTRVNTGHSMAIVLDGKVKAYANIQEEIGTGNVSISGFNFEDANNIAITLRTAALPVELVIENQQTVSSFLSTKLIKNALYAILAGLSIILLFMPIYYKKAGIIADIALIMNLIFMIAILSSFGLTLTLTGIAGIILTIGMSVDANVIVFERIKEELREGKIVKTALENGFKKAFWTILDSNVTTFITALFLSYIATGPIQGFAVTLSVGIITSIFSSLFMSRLFFDTSIDLAKIPKLSILWRKQ